jgi:ubiquinone/menaquinone biosynthesis C-methylase UbiE/ADP-ribose pyrophosphatase YjhB (NUDIX family)
MPEILSLALFEQGDRALVTQRKADRAPFARQWVLPGDTMGEDESAEEALSRHCFRELSVEIDDVDFAETLYLEDEVTGTRYVANVFRVPAYGGEMRFRAAGDYDDARWLAAGDLAGVDMPAELRRWLQGDRRVASPAGPIAVAAAGDAPDNRAGWNAISKAYQARYQLPTDWLVYGPRCPDERELQLLGDVDGQRIVVLGCGGGQDCIVLARQGAQVTGIDLSDEQIAFGRRLAEKEGVLVTLLQGNVEELKGIDDESQDIALSLHALNYVERADRALGEAFRVLRPGGSLVFSVHHPFSACLDDTPPYGVVRSYWQVEQHWQWDFVEAGASARLRSWYRPVSAWFSLLTNAGFRVERILEPPPVEESRTAWDEDGGYALAKMRLVPGNLIVKASKP